MTDKPVKIIPGNRGSVEAMLEAVNGRASAFAITTYEEVESAASEAEKRLEGLPKAGRAGAKATYRPAGPSAKRYQYRALTTCLRMERRGAGWYLTGAVREEVYPAAPERLVVFVTQAQADEIARRAVAGFTVMAHA